jgi:hypothetical protein
MNQNQQTAIEAVPFDVRDKYGQLRTDFTDEEIAKLPAAKKKVFFALIEAWTGFNDAEAALKEVKQKLHAVVREKDALAVKLGEEKKISRIEALRDNIRAQSQMRGLTVEPKKVDPAKEAKIRKLEDQFRLLELQMYEGQLEEDKQDRAVREARAVNDAAIKMWIAAYPPKTARQALDEHLAKHREHAKTGKNVVSSELRHGAPSHLDAVLSAGSRGGSINYGFGRKHRLLNTRVPPRQ